MELNWKIWTIIGRIYEVKILLVEESQKQTKIYIKKSLLKKTKRKDLEKKIMNNPQLILITGSMATRICLEKQLQNYLPDEVTMETYSYEEGIPDFIEADVLLLSGESFEQRLKSEGRIHSEQKIIIGEKRIINIDRIESIVHIPPQTEVLLVNDTEASAMDAIVSLQEIGFDSFHYVPFWNGKELNEEISVAITMGEGHLIPETVKEAYDIGARLLSFATLAELWKMLNLPLHLLDTYIDTYVNKLISISRRIGDANRRADSLSQKLLALINSIDDGLLVFNRRTTVVSVCNEKLRKLFHIPHISVSGWKIADIIQDEKILPLLRCETEKEEWMVNVGGEDMLLSVFLVENDNIVCIFKATEKIQKESRKISRDLVQKGFYAKYTLDDILGISPEICEAKRKANRLAQTELTILIEGESGTGKELFASAIHRASRRRDYPYIAVNFSALQESLMESELFGYEDGAFTGAKKGGRIGLFEMADGGTIFLDEIGDIPLKMQTSLLRVLQEKEVLRIGGKEIKRVDVRVVAATNQNLEEKVRNGSFRKDLYYRLKIGYLHLPPLRSRRQDIPQLVNYFLQREGGKENMLTAEILKKMQEYSWPGNVRELKNTVAYMFALRDENGLRIEDLPEEEISFCIDRTDHLDRLENTEIGNSDLKPLPEQEEATRWKSPAETEEKIWYCIVCIIRDYNDTGQILSRETLLKSLHTSLDGQMSMYTLRQKLSRMKDEGLLQKGRGKGGIRLTDQGRQWIIQRNNKQAETSVQSSNSFF